MIAELRHVATGVVAVSAVWVAWGCGGGPSPQPPTPGATPTLDADFVGVWRNSNDQFRNWWEISATRTTNYGINRETGSCIWGEAEILGSDSIRVTFGRIGEGRLAVNVGPNGQEPRPEDRGRLVIFVGNSTSLHHRVPRRDICLIDGVHPPDAPYPD